MVGNGEGENSPSPNHLMNKESIDGVDQIVQELLEENKSNKLPYLLRTGFNLLNIGIQKYYNTMPKENEVFSQSISLKQSFIVVLLLHAVVIAGIMWTSSNKTAFAKEEDKKYVGVDAYPMDAKPEPMPSPKPQDDWPKRKKPIVITKSKPQYTKEYVVMKGDTITSISKKYKLNPVRLRILNKIKEDKIYVGQTLKLL